MAALLSVSGKSYFPPCPPRIEMWRAPEVPHLSCGVFITQKLSPPRWWQPQGSQLCIWLLRLQTAEAAGPDELEEPLPAAAEGNKRQHYATVAPSSFCPASRSYKYPRQAATTQNAKVECRSWVHGCASDWSNLLRGHVTSDLHLFKSHFVDQRLW